MNEKLKKMIYIVLGCFAILFLLLLLLTSCKKRMTIEKFETYLTESVQNYYEINENELPKENSILTLSLNDLVIKGIIDELDKTLEKDTNCSGNITIENNNNYYMYSPNLSCSSPRTNYKTKNLKDTLLETTVTSGSGLYNENSEYIFKGDNVNNYIIFDGILWRIIKINENNTIKLIENGRRRTVTWDDRYNSEKASNSGINSYIHNGLNSRMKDYLDNIYNTEEILTKEAKGYIKASDLCIGKRNLEETNNTGIIECSEKLENQYIGLIQLNEFLNASLDPNCINITAYECTNFNYLANAEIPYWTITALNDNSHQVYKIMGNVIPSNASSNGMAKMVINISENTNIKGSGTETDPYIVVGLQSEIKKFN